MVRQICALGDLNKGLNFRCCSSNSKIDPSRVVKNRDMLQLGVSGNRSEASNVCVGGGSSKIFVCACSCRTSKLYLFTSF